MMKKRTIAAALALMLCITALAVPALAHGGRYRHNSCARNICVGSCAGADGHSPCCGWRVRHACVDANRDGVCDYTHYCGAGYADADRNGICDNCGKACTGIAAGTGSVYYGSHCARSSGYTRHGCGHH